MGILQVIEFVLQLLTGVLSSIGTNPIYSGLVASVEKAVANIETARQEILTRNELEALRTKPQW